MLKNHRAHRTHSRYSSIDRKEQQATSLDCAHIITLLDRLAHEKDPKSKNEVLSLLKRALCESDRMQRHGQSLVRERLKNIQKRVEVAEENHIEMEQRNEAAREVIEGVIQDEQYTQGQAAVEGFYQGWLAEAQQIQQDDKYYNFH